jgi:hypothetical protein
MILLPLVPGDFCPQTQLYNPLPLPVARLWLPFKPA